MNVVLSLQTMPAAPFYTGRRAPSAPAVSLGAAPAGQIVVPAALRDSLSAIRIKWPTDLLRIKFNYDSDKGGILVRPAYGTVNAERTSRLNSIGRRLTFDDPFTDALIAFEEENGGPMELLAQFNGANNLITLYAVKGSNDF